MARNKIRVLIVDDSPVDRELLIAMIGGEPDFEVAGQAADAYEAREKIRTLSPDVVTLDVSMPGMDGIELLSRIRAQNAQAAVIVMTAALVIGVITLIGRIIYLASNHGETPAVAATASSPALKPEAALALPSGHDVKSVAMSGNALYRYDLAKEGTTLAGKSCGKLIADATATDCRAMCVALCVSAPCAQPHTRPMGAAPSALYPCWRRDFECDSRPPFFPLRWRCE